MPYRQFIANDTLRNYVILITDVFFFQSASNIELGWENSYVCNDDH